VFGALGTLHQSPDAFLCRVGIRLPPLLVLCTGNNSAIISRSSLSGEAVLEREATGVWSTLVLEDGLPIEAGRSWDQDLERWFQQVLRRRWR